MKHSTLRRTLIAGAASFMLAAVALAPVHARAETREVVIGYQDMVVPWRYAQASGAVEKATGYKVTYRKLGSGADVIRALASGSIQLGEAGSSPIAAGLSQGVDLSLFWILDNINDAEALVARNGSGVSKLADLKGKTLGVPYVSTSHFHALVALHQAGADPSTVKIVNLRPEVAAAWERGNIDATYIWDPALAKTKQSEKVLITSGEVAKESGKATFDGFVAPRKFAQDNPAFLNGFVRGARRYRCAIPRPQGRLDRRIETGAGGRAGIRRGRRRRSRILMGVSRIARGVLDPPLEFYRPLPPLAYLPLVVIWFGIDETAKIVVIWLACFAPIAMAARAGVKSATAEQVNAAWSLGANLRQVVWHVVLPAALPEILTGLRIAVGFGWTTLVAAEMVAATAGLGQMVLNASSFLRTDVVVMGIVLIGAIAWVFDFAMRAVERRLVPWKGR